jgi:hypothetical protein
LNIIVPEFRNNNIKLRMFPTLRDTTVISPDMFRIYFSIIYSAIKERYNVEFSRQFLDRYAHREVFASDMTHGKMKVI